ncbi:DUF983 domain-containing protein [Oceanibacterium hippocampi]|uniref:Zinc-finger protein n=1 Tax=Oceanibacterium hippocampi TaxID=745714 RepID=A0A1Y5SQ52_9PROT|nr:DUF983 domain-containing protein [Oceanibacterium hippocampi]SLN44096.1 hypothetical protein OCH7691_01851 [Oceanibacterium hippocampi]
MSIEYPSVVQDERPVRSLGRALLNGWRKRCPDCANSRMYDGYIKVRRTCPTCGLELHHQRADDAPPYFTISIVGHVVIAGVLVTEKLYAPPEWVHMAVWLPITLLLTLWMLPRIKGALIGLQWSRYMHGFGGHDD